MNILYFIFYTILIINKVNAGFLSSVFNICGCGGREEVIDKPERRKSRQENTQQLLTQYQDHYYKDFNTEDQNSASMGKKSYQESEQEEQPVTQPINIEKKIKYFRIKYDIPLDCETNLGLYEQLDNNNSVLGQGSFGKVFEYQNEAYKVVKDQPWSSIVMQLAVSEYQNLKLLANYDLKKGTDLFQQGIGCYVDVTEEENFLIIKQQLLGSDLLHEGKVTDGGYQYVTLDFIRYNPDFRFNLYSRLFQQLVIMKKHKLVHKDIKPENIAANINLNTLKQQFQGDNNNEVENIIKNSLNLKIIDFGLMDNIQNIQFSGSANYMHPKYFLRILLKSQYVFDVYSLAFSLGQIETYTKKDGKYIFEKFNNKSVDNYIGLWEKKNKKKMNMSQIDQVLETQMEDYRQRIIKHSCPSNLNQKIRRGLRVFNKKNYQQFYKDICQTCYTCVLASAIQLDPSKIPDAEQIIEGFRIVHQNAQKPLDSNIIIQFLKIIYTLMIQYLFCSQHSFVCKQFFIFNYSFLKYFLSITLKKFSTIAQVSFVFNLCIVFNLFLYFLLFNILVQILLIANQSQRKKAIILCRLIFVQQNIQNI